MKKCYGPDIVRISPDYSIYGPFVAASSGTGGFPADADGPQMLQEEFEILEALDRMSSARSDAAWHEAVTARDGALRRLLRAVNDMPPDYRELVVTRAVNPSTYYRSIPPNTDWYRDSSL